LLRYAGTDTALPVPLPTEADAAALRAAFEAAHERLFGFTQPEKGLIIEAVNVAAEGGGAEVPETPQELCDGPAPRAGRVRMHVNGAWREVPLVLREAMRPGEHISGPALIIEPNSQIVVEEGWQARMNAYGHIVLTHEENSGARRQNTPAAKLARAQDQDKEHARPDPVLLEVFNNLFMSIAEQMGEALRATASSVNIKERLDFSCRYSTPGAGWWPTRRTCRCIWAAWTGRWRPSSAPAVIPCGGEMPGC
jgi:5-oxoprolinase (ATP-hydrolysing)